MKFFSKKDFDIPNQQPFLAIKKLSKKVGNPFQYQNELIINHNNKE